MNLEDSQREEELNNSSEIGISDLDKFFIFLFVFVLIIIVIAFSTIKKNEGNFFNSIFNSIKNESTSPPVDVNRSDSDYYRDSVSKYYNDEEVQIDDLYIEGYIELSEWVDDDMVRFYVTDFGRNYKLTDKRNLVDNDVSKWYSLGHVNDEDMIYHETVKKEKMFYSPTDSYRLLNSSKNNLVVIHINAKDDYCLKLEGYCFKEGIEVLDSLSSNDDMNKKTTQKEGKIYAQRLKSEKGGFLREEYEVVDYKEVTKEMCSSIKKEMNADQVKVILGDPSLNIFEFGEDQSGRKMETWNYKGDSSKKTCSVVFIDGKTINVGSWTEGN